MRKTSTGQSRETYWRDRQALKVNEEVGKKDKHRQERQTQDSQGRQIGETGRH
jgi:hypothetical protein